MRFTDSEPEDPRIDGAFWEAPVLDREERLFDA